MLYPWIYVVLYWGVCTWYAPLSNIGMYMLLAIEMEEIKKQVQELLNQGVIKPSSSPCGSPGVGAKKGWHMEDVCGS